MRPAPVIRRLLTVAAAGIALVGCDPTEEPTAPRADPENALPTYAISDAAHQGLPHFFLLPPLVDRPVTRGSFDPTLAPTVEICELRGAVCGSIIATFTKEAGPGGVVITVDPGQQLYQVDWKTDQFSLSDAINYRIQVRVGTVLLGYMDVDVARNASQFKALNTNEVIGLVEGRTLPIKFRPEQGIPGRVQVSTPELRLEVGDERQLTAQVYDLHGQLVTEAFPLQWTTSSADVISVSASGLLLAKTSGRVTVKLSLATIEAIVAVIENITRRMAFVSTRNGEFDIYTVNGLGGDLKQLTSGPGISWQPAWSPDGSKIAFQRVTFGPHREEIWVMNADGSGQTNLSNVDSENLLDGNPEWSPDGARIVFNRFVFDQNQNEIWVMNADGSGQVNLSNDPVGDDFYGSWSPDGTRITFLKGSDPYLVPVDGGGAPTPVSTAAFGNTRPVFSPDGSRIAFDREGDLFTVAPDGSGLAQLTSGDALDMDALWSPDGGKIYFRSLTAAGDDYEIRVVNADGTGEHLVAISSAADNGSKGLDITSDGVRLAFVKGTSTAFGTWEVFKSYTDGTGEMNLSNAPGAKDFMLTWRP